MADVYIHIGEMLARNARKFPNDVALVERIPAEKKRNEITWKQFDDQANQFSNVLAAKGVTKDDKVLHFMMNSIDWLVAYFGVVRTGAWVVPLNFRFTAEDVKYCSEVAEPTVVVYDEEFAPRIDAIKDQLPTVKSFICLGEKIPAYAESFKKLMDTASAKSHLVQPDNLSRFFLLIRIWFAHVLRKTLTIGRPKRMSSSSCLPCIIPARRCTGLEVLLLGQRQSF